MKLLIPVLVVLTVGCCWAQTSTDTTVQTSAVPSSTASEGSSTTGGSGDLTTVGTGGTAGTAETQGSAATGGSSDTTVVASTQVPTTIPLILTTFQISNDLTPQDAKLILQQALQLDQQIQDLNTYLINAKADTDVNNSPLFKQLNDFSANITAQNATLQGYVLQLQAISTTESTIDQRVNSATDTFTCFSQSSCVTPTPTTPEPTSPGPTPPVTACTNPAKLTATTVSASYNQTATQNAANCSVSVVPSISTNNVSVLIDLVISGNNASVVLVETRTQRSVSFNTTTTGYNFTGFQEVDIQYFSDPRSTVQFNITYIEVDTCILDCHAPNGTCKVSQSGVQYCECLKCQFSGDSCETPLDPCQSKQRRLCGENNKNKDGEIQGYGKCYLDICVDQCWACSCTTGAVVENNPQSCQKPSTDDFPLPTVPPGPSVCPTSAAPSTTAAILTSTMAPAVSTPAGTVPSGATTGASDASTTAAGSVPTGQSSETTVTVETSSAATSVETSAATSLGSSTAD